jgi:hypothetical protein
MPSCAIYCFLMTVQYENGEKKIYCCEPKKKRERDERRNNANVNCECEHEKEENQE